MKDETLAATALRHYKLASDAYEKQYKREVEDLRFQVPEYQWDEASRNAREGTQGGGNPIPPRPILSIPKLDQPIQLVLNQERAAQLGVNVHPLSEDADDDTAEVIQGLYRKIERDCNAQQARSWAFERAVKAGRGAYRVNTRYDEEGGHPFDQKITIERILYQSSVLFDPSAQEADFSDGEFAFVSVWVPMKTFKRLYPKAKAANADELTWESIQEVTPGWVKFDGVDQAVRVSEYYVKKHETESISLLSDGQVVSSKEVPEGVQVLQTRDRDKVTVWVHKLAPGDSGLEEIEAAQEWNGQYIPIIPVIGRELVPFDSERRWTGVVGPAKDAQRLYNYAASTAVELASMEPRAPWIGVEGQFEGHENKWLQANTRNFPYLEYKATDLSGQPVPGPPQRVQVDVSRLGPSMQLLQQADDFIQSTTFTPDPALGNLNSRDRSGKAIQALQGQSDASTSNYMHSLSQISMRYEARVILDMMPKIYDREGRVLQILQMDEEPKTVMLNAPHTMDESGRPQMSPPPGMGMPQMGPQDAQMPPGPPQGPPGTPMGQQQAPKPPKPVTYDLRKGSYGVSITVGKSWQSRLQQGSEEIGQILQASPELMPLIGPIYFKFRDFPGAKEISDVLKKVQDQQFPGLKDDDGQDDIDSLKAQLAAGKQQFDQAKQAIQEMTQQIETDQAKQQAMLQKAQMETQAKMQMGQMDAQQEAAQAKSDGMLQIMVEKLKAQADMELERMKEEFAMQKLEQEQRFEALQAGLERKHAEEMAEHAAQVSADMAEREAKDKDEKGEE